MKKIILSILTVLLCGSLLQGAQTASSLSPGNHALAGYCTIGSTVIALPSRLRTGDRILVLDVNGDVAFDRRISSGYFTINTAHLKSGVYIFSVQRNGEVIASIRFPFQSA